MDSSILNTIPGELRNTIWHFALVEPDGIKIEHDTKLPALLQTCRKIRRESYSIYFADNTFKISVRERGPFKPSTSWFKRVGHEATKLIPRLEIRQSRAKSNDQPIDYAKLLFHCRAWMAQAAESIAGILVGFLQETGVHPSLVRDLGPVEKVNWWDATWMLMKEALDHELANLIKAADEGEEGLDEDA